MSRRCAHDQLGLQHSYLSFAELHVDGVQLRLILQLAVACKGGLRGSQPCLHDMSCLDPHYQ